MGHPVESNPLNTELQPAQLGVDPMLVERGNQAYGGYGSLANFLLYGHKKATHPILISRDIHTMLDGQ